MNGEVQTQVQAPDIKLASFVQGQSGISGSGAYAAPEVSFEAIFSNLFQEKKTFEMQTVSNRTNAHQSGQKNNNVDESKTRQKDYHRTQKAVSLRKRSDNSSRKTSDDNGQAKSGNTSSTDNKNDVSRSGKVFSSQKNNSARNDSGNVGDKKTASTTDAKESSKVTTSPAQVETESNSNMEIDSEKLDALAKELRELLLLSKKEEWTENDLTSVLDLLDQLGIDTQSLFDAYQVQNAGQLFVDNARMDDLKDQLNDLMSFITGDNNYQPDSSNKDTNINNETPVIDMTLVDNGEENKNQDDNNVNDKDKNLHGADSEFQPVKEEIKKSVQNIMNAFKDEYDTKLTDNEKELISNKLNSLTSKLVEGKTVSQDDQHHTDSSLKGSLPDIAENAVRREEIPDEQPAVKTSKKAARQVHHNNNGDNVQARPVANADEVRTQSTVNNQDMSLKVETAKSARQVSPAQSSSQGDQPQLNLQNRNAEGKTSSETFSKSRVLSYSTPTRHTESSHIIQQIVKYASMSTKADGTTEMSIRLKPEFLGNMHLKVSMENGQLSTRIITETHAAKHIIENNISDLKTAMAEHGINIDNIQVIVGDAYSRARDDFSSGNSDMRNDGNRRQDNLELLSDIEGDIKTEGDIVSQHNRYGRLYQLDMVA